MEISSNHTFVLPAPRPAVWDALAEVSAYRAWWPWLRRFEAEGLEEGEVWRCTIRPPLPYALRSTVALVTVRAPTLVVARLTGDIAGEARLDLTDVTDATDATDATHARITSRLQARHRAARLLSRVAPAAARWGHDWVFTTAARQFEAAIAASSASP
jgi:uncharacterized protein YndB with AHSA1/START domain